MVHRRKYEQGFSLVEAIVVLGLIAAIVAITIPMLTHMLQAWTADTAAAQIAVNLRFARNAAVKTKLKYRVVITADPTNTYVVQKEKGYGFGTYESVNTLDYKLPQGTKISATNTITFNFRGANDSGTTYTFNVASVTGTIWQISVSPVGGVTKTKITS